MVSQALSSQLCAHIYVDYANVIIKFVPSTLMLTRLWGRSMTTWTRRGGRWSKKCQFLSTVKVNNVHSYGGRCWSKRAKLCPRSHLMSPIAQWGEILSFIFTKNHNKIECMYYLLHGQKYIWAFRNDLTP